ncbi:hypothetical protein Bca101_014227 [Brassica carinata]
MEGRSISCGLCDSTSSMILFGIFVLQQDLALFRIGSSMVRCMIDLMPERKIDGVFFSLGTQQRLSMFSVGCLKICSATSNCYSSGEDDELRTVMSVYHVSRHNTLLCFN